MRYGWEDKLATAQFTILYKGKAGILLLTDEYFDERK